MDKYSILVVDDEKLARQYVMDLLDWSKIGVNTLYEADNCMSAFEIVRTHKPDIIILDIRMPEMDGMDLLSLMQKNHIDAEVIVLSGYSNFENARKMLATGIVTDYLVKPVSEDLAAEAVVKAIANIEKKREHANMQCMLSSVVKNEQRRIYNSYILGVPYEQESDVPLNSKFLSMQIAVLYCERDYPAIKELCMAIAADQTSHLQDIYAGGQSNYYVLFFASEFHMEETDIEQICRTICEKMQCFCGIGKQYSSIFDLNSSYRMAYFACESRLFIKKSVIGINEVKRESENSINRDEYIKLMTGYVRSNNYDKTEELLKKTFQSFFFKYSGDQVNKSVDISMAKAFFAFSLESINIYKNNQLNLSYIFSASNVNELFTTIKNTLYQECDYYTQDKSQHKLNLIKKVKQFIIENYDQQITLNQAADIVFINPSYLSRLFSEIDGCVFTDFIAKVRISEAKKLLLDRKYKIYEIADLVGYNSFKYFLKVFKEKEGITPAQYRDKNMSI